MRGLKSCVFESRTTAGRFNFSTNSRSERRVFRSGQNWQSTMPGSMDYHPSAQRPPVSRFSRNDANSTPIWSGYPAPPEMSLTASKPICSPLQHNIKFAGWAAASIWSRAGTAIPFNTDFLGSNLYLGQIWDKPLGGYKPCWNQRLKESW